MKASKKRGDYKRTFRCRACGEEKDIEEAVMSLVHHDKSSTICYGCLYDRLFGEIGKEKANGNKR